MGADLINVSQVAQTTPLDNVGTDYEAQNVRDALIEIDFRQLVKEPTGHENRAQSVMSFDDGTRTFSISVNSPTYSFFRTWIRGHSFTYTTTQTVQISDVSGGHFIYFDSTGTLVESTTPWDFEEEVVFTALVLWDSVHQEHLCLGEERHSVVMDWATHKRLHRVVGSQVERNSFKLGNYILRGDGSLDAHVQFSVSNGFLHDEDIIMSIVNSASPSAPFEQVLSPIARPELFWREGTNGDWHKESTTGIPVSYDGTGLQWNEWTGSTWQLTNLTEGYYCSYWLIVTNCQEAPIKIVVAQGEANNGISAGSNVTVQEILTGLPVTEVVGLYKLIYQYSSSYTNTPKAILYAFADVLDINLDIDRYNFTASYGGNANAGRVLEIFAGVDSVNAPFIFPENSFLRTVTYHAAATASFTVGFYVLPNVTTPQFALDVTTSSDEKWEISEFFPADSQISMIISSGSVNKPTFRIWVQTDLN